MRATFESSVPETDTIRTFYFQTEQPLDYIAGNFIEITVPHDNADSNGTRRWFTLSSSPTEPRLAVTVRYRAATTASSFKRSLQALEPGNIVTISDPMGDFVLPLTSSIPLIWIAGGVGVTPYRSMAKWLADNGEQRTISLLHVVRDEQETSLFGSVFQAAGVSCRYLIHRDGPQPLDIASLVQPDNAGQPLWFVSGASAFVGSVRHDLQAAGIGNQDIITDEFLGY